MTEKRINAMVARQRWRLVVLLATALLGLFIVMGSHIALAQADNATPTPMQEEEPAAQVTEPAKASPDQVDVVARQLWCPLCNGVRLDACELKACDQMKDMIAVKLAAGENAESIKAYFVQQYGPQVTGEPPRSGYNWLAWLLPGLAAVVGGYFFWRSTQRMMQPAAPPVSSEATASPVSPSAKPNGGELGDEEDEYTRKLEEELTKYG